LSCELLNLFSASVYRGENKKKNSKVQEKRQNNSGVFV
jgi:hypothetical protein